jgi:hypothetical protein
MSGSEPVHAAADCSTAEPRTNPQIPTWNHSQLNTCSSKAGHTSKNAFFYRAQNNKAISAFHSGHTARQHPNKNAHSNEVKRPTVILVVIGKREDVEALWTEIEL